MSLIALGAVTFSAAAVVFVKVKNGLVSWSAAVSETADFAIDLLAAIEGEKP